MPAVNQAAGYKRFPPYGRRPPLHFFSGWEAAVCAGLVALPRLLGLCHTQHTEEVVVHTALFIGRVWPIPHLHQVANKMVVLVCGKEPCLQGLDLSTCLPAWILPGLLITHDDVLSVCMP